MKQLINNKLLRRMDSFALIGNQKEQIQPEPWCCASPSQGPSRVLLYFDKAHPLPNRTRKDGNLSSQASKWES